MPAGVSATRRRSSAVSNRSRRRYVPGGGASDGIQAVRRSSSGQSLVSIRDTTAERKAVLRKGVKKRSWEGEFGHAEWPGWTQIGKADDETFFEDAFKAMVVEETPEEREVEDYFVVNAKERRFTRRRGSKPKVLKSPGLGKLETRLRELASRLPPSPKSKGRSRADSDRDREGVYASESPNEESSRWALRCS